MIRRSAVIFTLTAVWLGPLSTPVSVGVQESVTDCASAFWLEAPAATPEPGTAEIQETRSVWLTPPLTDACSGKAFTLADFTGKTIFIESMATWCVNCHEQLTRMQDAASQIPQDERDDIVLVALSSEVGLPRADLAKYAAETGFPLIFAVMPETMLKAMADDLGQAVAIPPAMPHLIVAPDGAIGELHTGESSAEELLSLFAEARASSTP